MNDLDIALKAVLDRPGDLAARLAYADALDARDDPLGQFIRLDCRLDRSRRVDDDLASWDERFASLDAHGDAWLAPLTGIARSARIERGLVESVRLDLDTYLERGAEIFGRFPIRRLALDGVGGRMAEVAASPWIGRLEALSFPKHKHEWGHDPFLTDDDVAELTASDRLTNLRELDLGSNEGVGPRSVASILNAPWCGRLERLDLRWTTLGDEGALLLAATERLRNLRGLNLSWSRIGPTGARALADSKTLARLGLAEFGFCGNPDFPSANLSSASEIKARFLRSPVLARVEQVYLDADLDLELVEALMGSEHLGSMKDLVIGHGGAVETPSLRRLAGWPGLERLDQLTFVLIGLDDDQLELLGASPRLANLRSFTLSETNVSDDGVVRFCRLPVRRRLESLDIDRHFLTERSIRAILAAEWFPNLLRLDLHASYKLGDAAAAALAAHAGPTRLRQLTLGLAGMSDEAAAALVGAPYASQLWTLWLLGNDFSPAAAEALRTRYGGRVQIDMPDVRDWHTWSV